MREPALDLFIQAEAARNPLEIRIYINLLSQQETGGTDIVRHYSRQEPPAPHIFMRKRPDMIP